MKTNEELQRDVQDAIKWEPLLNAAEIGVTVKDGVVSLTGIVNSYGKKLEAEDAAKSVSGVKAVVENIQIRFGKGITSDNDIAIDVLDALRFNWDVPDDKITVEVEEGWVSLEGEMQWNHQKEAAKNAIKNLIGVKGVTNNITIKAISQDEVEKKAIENALNRNWTTDDQPIRVSVLGNRVTLKGTVGSIYQKDEAGRIAWNAPGVWNVENELMIDFD